MRALARQPETRQATLALAAGYSNQSHFTRAFKRLLSMNPGDFFRYIGNFHSASLPICTELNKELEGRWAGNSKVSGTPRHKFA